MPSAATGMIAPTRDRLCENWRPAGPTPAVGTPICDLAEQILREEFGSNNYRESIGKALVEGIGQWKSAESCAKFTEKGQASVVDMKKKLVQIFSGEFAVTKRAFMSASPVQEATNALPEPFLCKISYEVITHVDVPNCIVNISLVHRT